MEIKALEEYIKEAERRDRKDRKRKPVEDINERPKQKRRFYDDVGKSSTVYFYRVFQRRGDCYAVSAISRNKDEFESMEIYDLKLLATYDVEDKEALYVLGTINGALRDLLVKKGFAYNIYRNGDENWYRERIDYAMEFYRGNLVSRASFNNAQLAINAAVIILTKSALEGKAYNEVYDVMKLLAPHVKQI
nr:hypothetical protein K-LCC10_0496 [Kaumoebavirus]